MKPSRALVACTAAAVTALTGGAVLADDSEIYVDRSRTVAPNVLLIIDTSSSMANADAGGMTRLQAVQAAASALVDSLDGVNLGLMRFSSTGSGTGDAAAEGGMVVHAIEPVASARDSLRASIAALTASGLTPLSETLYEAGQYFAGRAVDYGQRSATAEGTVPLPSVPAARDPLAPSRYASPITHPCQRSYAVLLTDGEPSADTGASARIRALPDFARIVGDDCSGTGEGACLADMAQYLAEADLAPDLPGAQHVITHAVGFGPAATDSTRLAEMAARGGGRVHRAADTAGLAASLQAVITGIRQTSAAFATPSVTVDAFSRSAAPDALYVASFAPHATAHWPGNLKKYAFRDGRILDAAGRDVVDPLTGLLRERTQSLWSDEPDGAPVEAGGAAGRLPDEPRRRVYTHFDGNPTDLTAPGNRFELANPALTPARLGLAEAADPSRESLIDWARGRDVQDHDADGDRTEPHRRIGDSPHARPALVSYGGSPAAPDRDDAVVYLPTNDGFLHAIDARTGRELWAFIPPGLLARLPALYRDTGVDARDYGLDAEVQALVFDAALDRIVDPSAGDRVWLFFGMRRGGRHYYALDVSERDRPRLRWTLGPDTLPGVGETWSVPTIARLRVGGAAQNAEHLVLVFGGGYDAVQDDGARVADTVGHRLYIVDAASGALLWYAGGPDGEGRPDLLLPGMTNSIPGRVRVLDTDGDAYADRLYAADMGGRVFRIDLFNGRSRDALAAGGVFARLGAGDVPGAAPHDHRRFYSAPDLALMREPGAMPWYLVALGSGWRGHPLRTDTHDRFYALRDPAPFTALTQADYDRLAPITDAGLPDLADTPASLGVSGNAPGWKLELRLGGGWRGEKVLAEAVTVNGVILFTTYRPAPPDPDEPCLPPAGINRVYALAAGSGGAAIDFDDDGRLTERDLFFELEQTGIAGEVSVAYDDIARRGDTGPGGDGSGGSVPPGEAGEDPLARRAHCMVGVEVLKKCVPPGGLTRTFWQRVGVDGVDD
ncbi:MAG: PQQ-binding-like beta-propeller repeat protein [Steroidobacteraceae bacterium]|nr:PQQ-binding-like beta-propeller repeat protein [Steroidobacteraceae bacterium]